MHFYSVSTQLSVYGEVKSVRIKFQKYRQSDGVLISSFSSVGMNFERNLCDTVYT